MSPFSVSSVDGRIRCENAMVDADRFIRFLKSRGFRKRISEDGALGEA